MESPSPAPHEQTDAVMPETPTQEIETQVVLTAPSSRQQPHPLLSKPCRQLDRNSYFAARPAAIQFAGFEVSRTISARLELVNISRTARRLNIVAPQTSYFQMRHAKTGRVAPGLSQVVWVDFTADAWRYYYDAVRIFCEDDETLLVPIHAYPVMRKGGSVFMADRLDFGTCALKDTVVKFLEIQCDVPVAFEYKMRVLQPNAQFEVLTPPVGVIPALGSIRLRIRYQPRVLGTATMRMEVEVSQLDASPRTLVVVGNAVPRSLPRPSKALPLSPPKHSVGESTKLKSKVRRRWKSEDDGGPAEQHEAVGRYPRITPSDVQRAIKAERQRFAGAVDTPARPGEPLDSSEHQVSVNHTEPLSGRVASTCWLDSTKNDWNKRHQTIRRFVSAVSLVILRRRASIRLAKIKARLGGCSTRAEVAELVAADNEAADATSGVRLMRESAVCETLIAGMEKPADKVGSGRAAATFPIFVEDDTRHRPTISGTLQPDWIISPTFDDVRSLSVEAIDPLSAALKYAPLEPYSPFYFPSELGDSSVCHVGAEDEALVRPPRGTAISDWEKERSVLEPAIAASDMKDDDPVARSRKAWEAELLVVAANLAGHPHSAMPSWLATSKADCDNWKAVSTQRADLPYQTPPADNEAKIDWALRPRYIPRPPTLAARIASARLSRTATFYATFPEPSRAYRVKAERASSALSCLAEQYHLRGWAVEAAVPLPLAGQAPEDCLSESESDDESTLAQQPVPTPETCRELLGIHVVEDGINSSPLRTPSLFARSCDDSHGADRLPIVSDIPRDRNRLELYRNYTAKRSKDAARLNSNLKQLADNLRDQRVSFGYTTPRMPSTPAGGAPTLDTSVS